jgi:multimeric flavodoxin WrbA
MVKEAICVAFSARREGNCLRVIKYIQKLLQAREWNVEVINLYDFVVTSCSHCDYECFKSDKEIRCPINDDVRMIYKKIMLSKLAIFVIPVYGGSPSSLYSAWKERAQGIIEGDEDYDKIARMPKGVIVIGNAEAGGSEAFAHVIADDMYRDAVYRAILLQAHEYGQNSISGNLVNEDVVKKRVHNFILRLLESSK